MRAPLNTRSGDQVFRPILRLTETVTDRVAHQARGIVYIELLHQLGAVRLDRLAADAESCGDRLGRTPLRDQLQHLALAHRKGSDRALARAVGLSDGGRDSRTEVDLTAADGLDGLHQVACRLILQDVSPDAAAQGFGDILRLIMLCENYHLHARRAARQLE